MARGVLLACLPWLALLVVSCALAYMLLRLNRARIELGRLRLLHRDEAGGVQSLSFVLTLPLLVMVMLFIVQVSQLMIGTIVVHYAAYAAARSAIVWIPARVSDWEAENCVYWFEEDPLAADNRRPITDPDDPRYGWSGALAGGVTFVVEPAGEKYEKIYTAAALGCMPICPSRDLSLGLTGEGRAVAEIVKQLYESMAPGSLGGSRVAPRLENKLAYSLSATTIEVRFFHPNAEPPLPRQYVINADVDEPPPNQNEIGWQDPITVTVRHRMALLPGPGRLLARGVRRPDGSPDRLAEKIQQIDGVYTYPLEASVTMGNEGERSVVPYQHWLY